MERSTLQCQLVQFIAEQPILCMIFQYKCSEWIQRWYDDVLCQIMAEIQISGIPLGAARYQLSIKLSIKVNHTLICHTFYFKI